MTLVPPVVRAAQSSRARLDIHCFFLVQLCIVREACNYLMGEGEL